MPMSSRKGVTNDRKLIEAARRWASGESLIEIAKDLKVARATAYRWKQLPRFAELVAEHRYQAMTQCFGKCVDLQEQAIDTLGDLLRHKSPQIRLKAAQAITQLNYQLFVDRQADAAVVELEQAVLKLTPARIPADHNQTINAEVVEV